MLDSRQRFSDRVEDYVRYRPGYPPALVSAALAASGDPAALKAADIGSGTGIFTRLLLQRGVAVTGIEPNARMRRAAEQALRSFANFTSLDGTAENTGLGDACVGLVTAAQAFHWFHNAQTRMEFARILKADGRLALVWNRRRLAEPFQRAYEALLREHAPEYRNVNQLALEDGEIGGFFAPGRMTVSNYDNEQRLDFRGLLGRLKSASYCPAADTPEYRSLAAGLERLFTRHAVDGAIRFTYDSRLYLGPIAR